GREKGGREPTRMQVTARHSAQGRRRGQAVLPTQLITKPLQIEVLNRGRQRVKQIVAPVGATLPGKFTCTCRTVDQAGRIIVPIFEENRVIKHMLINDLDPKLPVGSPVDVELSIDVKHNIEVKVLVREAGRCETAAIEAPPPPRRPTEGDIFDVQRELEQILPTFSGSYRSRVRSRIAQLLKDLHEALRYEDEPKAIQRMAELRDLLDQLLARRGTALEPPWTRFEQQVKDGLKLAEVVARETGRDKDELCEQIHAQERYAEQAFEEHNQALYKECWEKLEKYCWHLEQLLREKYPRGPIPERSPEEEARDLVQRFRAYLSDLWN